MKTLTILFLLFTLNTYSQNSDWMYRSPNPQNDFYGIKFFNENTGYVIGSGGTLLKNVSGSSNWINIPTYTTRDLYAMYFFDVNTGYIAGDGGLILYTSSGGTSWTSVAATNSYSFRSITFINQNTGFVVGDHGELFKTTSGITGWQPSNITTTNLRDVYFYDSLKGFICGDSGKILTTTNCGANWSVQTVGTADLLSVSFVNFLTGYMTVKPSGVLKTTDGGNSWNSVNLFIQGNDNYLKFINSNTGYIFGKNGPVSRTTNGGLNWNTWCSSQLFTGNTYYDISPVDSNTAYLCGAQGWILRCYGQQPNQYAVHIGGSISPLSRISFTSPSTGAMMGNSSILFTTTNGGDKWDISLCGSNSWFEGSGSLTDLWLFSPTSWYREMYYPGIGGFPSFYIQHSTDGGLNWAGPRYFGSIGFGINDVFETSGVTYLTYNSQVMKSTGSGWNAVYTGSSTGKIYFADTNTGFVSTYTSGLKSVLYTSNGGSNWVNYSTGSTKNIESVFLRSSGLGFAGCDSALLLRTTNFGLNWVQIPVPNNLHVQNIRFANESMGWFIGTDHTYPGSGRLFVSNNGGTSFQQMLSLGSFDVKGFSFIDAQNGYVCGDSGVVLKTTNGGLTFTNQNTGIIPNNYSLSQNYPNPFNPVTSIKFDIPNSGFVEITIYDVLGREVTQLVNQQLQPGSYNVDWDASNYPSGVYFYSLVVGNNTNKAGYRDTKKMVLIK